MTYTFEKKDVLYNGKKIYELPSEVSTYLTNEFNDSVIVVYRGIDFKPKVEGYAIGLEPKVEDPALQKLISQNVLCINAAGNLLWQIEPTTEYPHWFFSLVKKNGEVWARRIDQWRGQLDVRTGKVIKSDLDL